MSHAFDSSDAHVPPTPTQHVDDDLRSETGSTAPAHSLPSMNFNVTADERDASSPKSESPAGLATPGRKSTAAAPDHNHNHHHHHHHHPLAFPSNLDCHGPAGVTTMPTVSVGVTAQPPPKVRNVYVAALPLSFQENDLRSLLEPFGELESLRMFNTGQRVREIGRAYGFALYKVAASAEAAVAGLDGMSLGTARIQCQLSRNGVVKAPRDLSQSAIVPLMQSASANEALPTPPSANAVPPFSIRVDGTPPPSHFISLSEQRPSGAADPHNLLPFPATAMHQQPATSAAASASAQFLAGASAPPFMALSHNAMSMSTAAGTSHGAFSHPSQSAIALSHPPTHGSSFVPSTSAPYVHHHNTVPFVAPFTAHGDQPPPPPQHQPHQQQHLLVPPPTGYVSRVPSAGFAFTPNGAAHSQQQQPQQQPQQQQQPHIQQPHHHHFLQQQPLTPAPIVGNHPSHTNMGPPSHTHVYTHQHQHQHQHQHLQPPDSGTGYGNVPLLHLGGQHHYGAQW